MTVDLATAWDAYAADQGLQRMDGIAFALARRRFYSGAMAAIEILRHGDRTTMDSLTRELVEYGRTIGTSAERAR